MDERAEGIFYTDAEYTAPEQPPKRRVLPVIMTVTTVITGISGILAYAYIGLLVAGCFSHIGLGEFAAKCVFDGVVKKIEPVTESYEDPVYESVDDEMNDDTSQEKYVNIVSEDLSCKDPGFVFNETGYDTNDLSVEVSVAVPEYREGSTVLIIHSHGTESYSEGDTASADENFRTDDTEKNMIAVGKRFADTLADNGINVIHCTEMFDLKSYPDAYNNSAAAVKSYMERYPGIQYVLDIHRDAVIRADGDVVKSDGGEGAQIMIVCGTDSMGADFPRWRENYVFGTEYQRIMREESPSLVRYMNLRNASFNQQLCNRYLLLEIGTCGNTLEEALSSAEFAANAFARLVRGE